MRIAIILLALNTCHAADLLQITQTQAAAFERNRQWAEAAAVYRAALEQGGPALSATNQFVLRLALSEMAFNQRDYAESRRWLRQAEPFVPTPEARVSFFNARAALHIVEGNLSAARRDLDAAAAIAPSAATLHHLASIEAQTGALLSAQAHEQEALSLWRSEFGPNHEYVRRAWVSLSAIQVLRKDWESAAQSLGNALAIAEAPDALTNYAVVLDHLHRGKEARAIRSRLPRPLRPNALVDVQSLRGQSPVNVLVR